MNESFPPASSARWVSFYWKQCGVLGVYERCTVQYHVRELSPFLFHNRTSQVTSNPTPSRGRSNLPEDIQEVSTVTSRMSLSQSLVPEIRDLIFFSIVVVLRLLYYSIMCWDVLVVLEYCTTRLQYYYYGTRVVLTNS
jgi:hypothetical protein